MYYIFVLNLFIYLLNAYYIANCFSIYIYMYDMIYDSVHDIVYDFAAEVFRTAHGDQRTGEWREAWGFCSRENHRVKG